MLFPPLFSFLLLSFQLALASEDLRYHICNDTTAYSANSTFSANLALALDTIRNNTAVTGFNATTTGNQTAPVTVLALCRASLSPSDCQSCIDAATLGVRRACPNQREAQVWYTMCMVRYSSVNFINKAHNSIAFMIYDVRDAPNQDSYDQTVKILMQKLSSAAGLSIIGSAVGRTSMVGNRSIYGYVECTRDITSGDCTSCLSRAIDAIPSCCLGKWAGWIATPSCNIQFNMDPVHDDWVNAPQIDTDTLPAPMPMPEPVPVPVPVPLPVPSSDGRGGRGNQLMTGISIAVFVTAMLG